MENFHWKYCLNEEQFTKLYRIICKIPGLLQYLTDHNGRELTSIITSFKMLIESEGTSTSGIRTNLELIIKKFDLFRKEFEDKQVAVLPSRYQGLKGGRDPVDAHAPSAGLPRPASH